MDNELAVQSPTAVEASQTWLWTAVGGRKESAMNWTLVAGMVAAMAWNAFYDWRSSDLVAVLPMSLLCIVAARKLSRAGAPSAVWLRVSGFASLLITGLSLMALPDALTGPVDVACVVWSIGMTALFGYAAAYELLRAQSVAKSFPAN